MVYVNFKRILLSVLLLIGMAGHQLQADSLLNEDDILALRNTPISDERFELEAELYDLFYDGVAPIAERNKTTSAFGIPMGVPFSESMGEVIAFTPPSPFNGWYETVELSPPKPHSLIDIYTTHRTLKTKVVYKVIGARRFDTIEASPTAMTCSKALEAIADELQSDYPSSFVVHDTDTLFVIHTANAQISVECESDRQLEVSYDLDFFKSLAAEESEDLSGEQININSNTRPFFERDRLQPDFGIDWYEPFEPPQLMPARATTWDYLPKESADFPQHYDQYGVGVDGYSYLPWMAYGASDNMEHSACMAIAKEQAALLREQYPNSAWIEYPLEEGFKFTVSAIGGSRITSGCVKTEEGYRLTKFYLAMFDSFRESDLANEQIYDAASVILGEPRLFIDEESEDADAVVRLVERYRHLNP